MLRRWLAHFRLCFGTEAGEELRGHHLRRALDHALAHARDRPANLNVSRVSDLRARCCLLEI